jgi:hypothetical protein
MSRAHEESQTKSLRVKAAWENKRAHAATARVTKICPAWLEPIEGKQGFSKIPDRAKVVRDIFNQAAAGIGMYSIANRLNKARVLAFGSKNGWHQSYVAKILANRAVLGEYQPHRFVDGKRVPDGEPIKGYFPAVVDQALFHRVQFAKSQRRASEPAERGLHLAICSQVWHDVRIAEGP